MVDSAICEANYWLNVMPILFMVRTPASSCYAQNALTEYFESSDERDAATWERAGSLPADNDWMMIVCIASRRRAHSSQSLTVYNERGTDIR